MHGLVLSKLSLLLSYTVFQIEHPPLLYAVLSHKIINLEDHYYDS